jgi:uncharacterized protein (TIGR04255 family)
MDKQPCDTIIYYENAPIILAILQFRYKKIDDFDSQLFIKKGIDIKKKYPESKERVTQKIHFNEGDLKKQTNVSLDDRVVDGVQFISKDKNKVLIIGNEKFTFELNGKYTCWDEFMGEAKELWEFFSKELGDVSLTGVSLRYVNKIGLPKDIKNISDYFTTFINSSSGNHPMTNFQMKYSSYDEDSNYIIHAGHSLENELNDERPYIFDIDIIHLDDKLTNDPTIWKNFEGLRDKKNFVFNDGITDLTKKIIS